MYRVLFSKRAAKQKSLLRQAHLDKKARALLDVLALDPFQSPPPFEKLVGQHFASQSRLRRGGRLAAYVGDLSGAYSRRLNHQHRLVYTVDEAAAEVFVLSMWTHYE